jgi:hypothetical protein
MPTLVSYTIPIMSPKLHISAERLFAAKGLRQVEESEDESEDESEEEEEGADDHVKANDNNKNKPPPTPATLTLSPQQTEKKEGHAGFVERHYPFLSLPRQQHPRKERAPKKNNQHRRQRESPPPRPRLPRLPRPRQL